MASRYQSPLVIDGFIGRNGADSPLALPDWQCAEALNVDFYDGTMARKRGGSESVSLTGGPSGLVPIKSLGRHVPGTTETAAELWAATAGGYWRIAGGSAWASVSVIDSVAGNFVGASFNGKFFLADDSSVNRLHVWDGTSHRRVGLAASAAPTVADLGAGTGAYPATLRYYKQMYLRISGSTVVSMSELSPVVSFTPVGTGTAARVTKAATISEGETHWRVYGSADGLEYFKLSGDILVATTTYDDSAAPSSYSSNEAAPLAGLNIPPPSAKYIVSDGSRLVMAGAWETSAASGQTAPKNNRVWYTRVLGSSDAGDDESIPNTVEQKNWVDLGENDGSGEITGLSMGQEGVVFVFKRTQTWRLRPTGDATTPYLPELVSSSVGCIRHQTIVNAEDENGNPAIYFLSARGPYRIVASGMQYLGRDMEDVYNVAMQDMSGFRAFGLWYQAKHQVWFHVLLSDLATERLLVFDTHLGRAGAGGVRGGWSQFSLITGGELVGLQRLCGVMFSNTLGASMSLDLKPYLGGWKSVTVESPRLYKYDTGTTDAGNAFQAYITTKAYMLAGPGTYAQTQQPTLLAEAGSATVALTINRDFGLEAPTATTVSLAASASGETRVIRKFEAGQLSHLAAVQFQLGDSAAVDSAWTLDSLVVPWAAQEMW